MTVGYLEAQRTTREANRVEARSLRLDGWSVTQIAARFGVTKSTAGLWSSEYALLRHRERRLGRKLEPRPCGGYACRVVIAASERANKVYCSKGCWDRAKAIREATR